MLQVDGDKWESVDRIIQSCIKNLKVPSCERINVVCYMSLLFICELHGDVHIIVVSPLTYVKFKYLSLSLKKVISGVSHSRSI